MSALINYLESGHSATELLTAMTVITGVIIGIEKAIKWITNIFVQLYKKKRGQEDEIATIDKNTSEIQKLSNKIEALTMLINKQYQHLDKKIDEQKERLTSFDAEGKKRDCALLRDRIIGGMRYFSQNIDEQGRVHISLTDHENMSHLFEEYFGCNGNGTVKTMYENEFQHWIIDN